jgi:hypothetical protein
VFSSVDWSGLPLPQLVAALRMQVGYDDPTVLRVWEGPKSGSATSGALEYQLRPLFGH